MDKYEEGSAKGVNIPRGKSSPQELPWKSFPVVDFGDRFMGETKKHLAGGKFDHDQKTHGMKRTASWGEIKARYGYEAALAHDRRRGRREKLENRRLIKQQEAARKAERDKLPGHDWKGIAHFDSGLKDSTGGRAGDTIQMNRKIWDEMGEDGRKGVIAHELAHNTIDTWRERKRGEWERADKALRTGETRSGMPAYLGFHTNLAEAIADLTAHYLGYTRILYDQTNTPAELAKAMRWIDTAFRRAGFTKENHLKDVERMYKMLDEEAKK